MDVYSGNYSSIFHHASPLFYLIYAKYVIFSPTLFFSVYFSVLINVIAVFKLINYVRKQFSLSVLNYALSFLFCGTSTFLVVSSGYLAIESLSLLFFILCVTSYHKHKIALSKFNRHVLLASFYFILLLGVNYKAILLIPIFFLLEFIFLGKINIQKSFRIKMVLILKSLFVLILILFTGVFLYSMLGVILGHDFLEYAKYFYVVAFIKDVNPNIEVPIFNWNLLFYVNYLFEFENFLLWISVVLAVIKWRKINFLFSIKNKSYNFIILITIISLCYLLGMSVLQKAPRGLLFIYPFLYVLTFLIFCKVVKKNYLMFMIFYVGIMYNLYLVNKHVYKYRKTNYPQMADYLYKNDINKLATTIGINISSFLKNTELKTVFNLKELHALKEKGLKYCLLDSYYLPTNTVEFEIMKTGEIVFKLKEPTLLSPYLYLEHAEYSGLSYSQAKSLHKKAVESKYQLFLVKL